MQTRSVHACRYDVLSLGEVMLRLDPGDRRIHTARSFDVWEGGGEYNVARGLRRCFGLRAGVLTALVDNSVGRLVEDLMLQGGVDTEHVVWKTFDGIGRSARNGLNFVERGFGPRGAISCSDRGNTAISQLKSDDLDWDAIFGEAGARLLHTGGIFAALSASAPDVALAAIRAAKRHGTRVSFDLNYRASLWRDFGGPARAQAVNRELAKEVDILFGNEEDFAAALGFEIEGVGGDFSSLESSAFKRMIASVTSEFPNIHTVATTLRTARSASVNGWGAICYDNGQFYEVPQSDLEIYDRVGGGDSFASGFLYGLLTEHDPHWALRCGVAHGALAMTTPGDTSMASLAEVERAMAGGGARVQR